VHLPNPEAKKTVRLPKDPLDMSMKIYIRAVVCSGMHPSGKVPRNGSGIIQCELRRFELCAFDEALFVFIDKLAPNPTGHHVVYVCEVLIFVKFAWGPIAGSPVLLAEVVEAGNHGVVAHCAVGLIFTGKRWNGLGFLHCR